MDFWREFLASSWGKEFVAGGFGGAAGIVAGHPLDTLRILQQSSTAVGTINILRRVLASEGPSALYRGMGASLASVTFQNAMVFQTYAVLSRGIDPSVNHKDPPSFKAVALAGIGAGALQSLLLGPVELIKIRLQLQEKSHSRATTQLGPMNVARNIFRTEGTRGIYRGLTITVLRDAPSYGVYFWTYEYMKEQLQPGCRKSGEESLRTTLIAGGLAGVFSWMSCYPLDVIKTRLQAQTKSSMKYSGGITDCYRKSVGQDGHGVLWRGRGTAVARAFVVNGAIFTVYELSLKLLFNHSSQESSIQAGNTL